MTRTLKRRDKPIEVLPREFRLLEYLMRNAGHVVTRTMLLEHLWDYRLAVGRGYALTVIATGSSVSSLAATHRATVSG